MSDRVTLKEWETKLYALPLWQLMRVIHKYTVRLRVDVIIGTEYVNHPRLHNFALTNDAFHGFNGVSGREKTKEIERLLKYYADVPCWNISADLEQVPGYMMGARYHGGYCVTPVIVARVHYKDIEEGYLREKKDIRCAKRRERASAARRCKP